MNEAINLTSVAGNSLDPHGALATAIASPGQPSPSDIAAFSEHMNVFRAIKAAPEQGVLDQVQTANGELTSTLLEAMTPADEVLSPASALRAQKQWQHSVHVVDFSAKVMGSISQSINKLVTMQ